MPLPFNPMSFVTPYTAVGTSRIGSGANFANVMNAARNTKVQEGYLANTQRRTDIDEQRYGQQEMDKARSQLDAAMLSGNSDMAEAALNNLKTIAERYGLTLAETRSDAALNTGVTDRVSEQKVLPGSAGKLRPDEVGSEEKPFDVDAYDAAQEQAAKDEMNRPFTGAPRTPGGSLPPQVAAGATAAPIRTPGGSLPPSETAEVKQAPLRGYTLIGRDGKPMYTVAPKDVEARQRQRVADVFIALGQKSDDPKEKQWIAEAQALAEKLVGTMPLDEAVREGLKMFTDRVRGAQSLAVVEANRKPRFGGGGGGGAPAGGWAIGKEGTARNQFSAEMDDTVRITMDKYKLPALNASDQAVRSAAAGLKRDDNPASQRIAVRQIIKAMSGLTVSVSEGRLYDQAVGLIAQMENMFNQITGEAMSAEYVAGIQNVVQQWIAIADQVRQQAANDGASYFAGKVHGRAPDEAIREGAGTVYNMLVGGGNAPKRPTASSKNAGGSPGKKLLEK